jgi:hypothetical protein
VNVQDIVVRSLVSSLVTRKNHDGPASPVGSEVTDRRRWADLAGLAV